MATKRVPTHWTTHRVQLQLSVKKEQTMEVFKIGLQLTGRLDRGPPGSIGRGLFGLMRQKWGFLIYYTCGEGKALHMSTNAPSAPWKQWQHHALVWKHGCRKLVQTRKENLKVTHFTARQWPQANTAKVPLCEGNRANVLRRPCQGPDLDLA